MAPEDLGQLGAAGATLDDRDVARPRQRLIERGCNSPQSFGGLDMGEPLHPLPCAGVADHRNGAIRRTVMDDEMQDQCSSGRDSICTDHADDPSRWQADSDDPATRGSTEPDDEAVLVPLAPLPHPARRDQPRRAGSGGHPPLAEFGHPAPVRPDRDGVCDGPPQVSPRLAPERAPRPAAGVEPGHDTDHGRDQGEQGEQWIPQQRSECGEDQRHDDGRRAGAGNGLSRGDGSWADRRPGR